MKTEVVQTEYGKLHIDYACSGYGPDGSMRICISARGELSHDVRFYDVAGSIFKWLPDKSEWTKEITCKGNVGPETREFLARIVSDALDAAAQKEDIVHEVVLDGIRRSLSGVEESIQSLQNAVSSKRKLLEDAVAYKTRLLADLAKLDH